MGVGSGDQLQRNTVFVEASLERLGRETDLRACIIVKTWKDVRRAGLHLDAIGHSYARHFQRHVDVSSAVVYTRQDV